MSIIKDTAMSAAELAAASRPQVWIIYHDKMKNVESAEKCGNLKEMFTGYVDYSTAVELTLKMLKGRYKPRDYLLEMGQPRLVAIVTTVAEKYFSADGTINMLCWNKREQEYFPQTFHFPDENQPMQVLESMEAG
jgi:hypothetical protein